MFCDVIAGLKRYMSSFSNNFDVMERRLIGLYDAARVASFPGLGIIIISEFFQDFGKYPVLNIELNT